MRRLYTPRLKKAGGVWAVYIRHPRHHRLTALERYYIREAEIWALQENRSVFVQMLRDRGIMLPSPTETTR